MSMTWSAAFRRCSCWIQTRRFEQRTDRKFLLRQKEGENGSSMHDPVNIGNPRELTVLEIAKLVLELTRSSSQITHHPLPRR